MTARVVQDELNIVVNDHRPIARDSREAILKAITEAAAARRGLVHVAAVRMRLPEWCAKEQVGAVICALVRSGHLVPTGRYEPNGDTAARNRSKPAAVRRLVKPIPPKDFR